MKTYSKIIYEDNYVGFSKWDQKIESYIKIERHFDFKNGLRYSVSVPNFTCCEKKLKDAILRVLEHESIGMAKYNGIKEIVNSKKLWNSICR